MSWSKYILNTPNVELYAFYCCIMYVKYLYMILVKKKCKTVQEAL